MKIGLYSSMVMNVCKISKYEKAINDCVNPFGVKGGQETKNMGTNSNPIFPCHCALFYLLRELGKI